MALALGDRQHLADVVDFGQPRLAERDDTRVGPALHRLFSIQAREPSPQGVVDELFERPFIVVSQPLEVCGDVVVEGQCRPHASKHKHHDVLMQ